MANSKRFGLVIFELRQELIYMGIYITIIVFVIVIAMGLLLGYYFTSQSFKPNYWSYEDSYDHEVKNGMLIPDNYNQLDKEEVIIQSKYTCDLKAIYFPNGDTKDTVIVCHGYSANLYGSVKYMNMFYALGFNVLIYDHRGHGASGKSLCSMGYIEKEDLKTCVDWIINRNGHEGVIGTHGESMGGATVLMHAAIDERVDFVIADCAFASVWDQFSHVLKEERRLPSFPILHVSSLVSKFRIGSFFSGIKPISGINDIKAPILFIHGDSDTYIPMEASQAMYDQRKGPKDIYFANGAEHAVSYVVDPERYKAEVSRFLQKYHYR